ncbi:uncharacterized protein ACLA_025890 [Aspergillus clavatus NRRL 1]|uniref:Uncharacterized protein n=1 Tax=Aspergillus clavatus (strain ATCC 1007 / CBS 513.65 / DSM 816 / NCTC 3887 / NRRL 1 / QM 1276 / 107) TaxID=344612 RepID=A1CQF1_ASPCL|nr:uncharacterized protein ACLA_025890 [Aspergillus clavatus NRRL 1]EAW07872.1 conserved hypothetical protein [Aspergillus clavatus NRRL 1]
MDSNEAPPPYSAVDPLLTPTSTSRNSDVSAETGRPLLRLRGGNASSLSDVVSRDGSTPSLDGSSMTSFTLPTNFASAAAYFTERPPTVLGEERPVLCHYLTIYPRSQSKDFPRRPRCWSPRTAEITQQDWDMFLRYLFPPHLGLAASSAHLPRQLRAEIQRDRKDRPQESDEQRQVRIATVIEEWNECFFGHRATRIDFIYVTDSERAPVSPLCPHCYPAATKASRTNRSTQAQEAGGVHTTALVNASPTAAAGQPPSPASTGYPSGMYSYQPHVPPAPYSPYAPPPFFAPGMAPHTPPPPHAYPYPPQPQSHYPQPGSWGWNHQPYNVPYQNTSTTKGGPLGWINSLASQAQKYGDRITEQAQHYGRQVEEQAMAHGRWIEEQAGLHSRKLEGVFGGFSGGPRVGYTTNDPRAQVYYPNAHAYPPVSVTIPQVAASPAPQPRRASVASVSSESSFSSIESISTTSELSSSDFATVRAQLLSMDDHHDRELYKAAVDLRRQLDVLRESRRQSRASGRAQRRNGWGHNGPDRGDWGRWESPQEQQRSSAEKRALKEEVRATKKVFKDVFKRAREEEKERRKLKRNRWRQEQRSRQTSRETERPPEALLEQRMGVLELNNTHESEPAVRSTTGSPSQAHSVSSEASVVSSVISTPSTVSSSRTHNNDANTAAVGVSGQTLSGQSMNPQGPGPKQNGSFQLSRKNLDSNSNNTASSAGK